MSNFQLDIPNLNVNVDSDINKTLVVLRQSPVSVNRSSIPIQNVAESAISASYALTASLALATVVSASYAATASVALNAMNTGSFATTGSNIFYGDQDAVGVYGDVNINIDEVEPHVEVRTTSGSENAEYHTYQLYHYTTSSGYFGFTIDAIRAGYTGWNGPAIAGNDNVDNYPVFIGFQDKTNYTDGRVTFLTPLVVSGAIIFPDGTTQSTATGTVVLPTSSLASPQTGSMYFSGSYIYVYDGTQYRSASLN